MEIIYRIFSGNHIIGYGIKDNLGNRLNKSIQETIDLIQLNQISNAKYVGNRVTGKGINISSLPRVQENKPKLSSIELIEGLGIHTEYAKYAHLSKRNQYAELYNKAKTSTRIIGLYGLRRTGKTVLLIQLANQLISEGFKVVYLQLSRRTEPIQLFKLLKSIYNKYDYLIIDEITYLEGFACWANQLELYNNTKTRLIIAGTQSFALYMARNDVLLDRVECIDTTYISYKEYYRLFNGANLLDYMQNGGVLNGSYLSKELTSYIDSSIVENIVQTLAGISDTSYYPMRETFDRGTLSSLINQIIYNSIDYQNIGRIKEPFKDKNLASALQMLKSSIKLEPIVITVMNDYTAYHLRIGNLSSRGNINSDTVEYIVNALYNLQFIEYKQVIQFRDKVRTVYDIGFNQPGIRYNQSIRTLNSLFRNRASLGLSVEEFNNLKTKLIQDISGRVLEEIIIINSMQVFGKDNVFQIQVPGNAEIDMAIQTEKGIKLYEIKLSKQIVPKQSRWLRDTKFCNQIEKQLITEIISKSVIYMGETTSVKVDGEAIQYINAQEFLLNI